MSFWQYARQRLDFWFYTACVIVFVAGLTALLIALLIAWLV